jgi:hypothetical protein
MERTTSLAEASIIMGDHFIGPIELSNHSMIIGLLNPLSQKLKIPEIKISIAELTKKSKTHILILYFPFYKDGTELTICKLRQHLNMNSQKAFFYNQDWYLNERFANSNFDKPTWVLINKYIIDASRGKVFFSNINKLYSATLLTYIFFVNFIINNKILWPNDYIWCSDSDNNGDQVYVGRYLDPLGIAKEGFSIHRHLRINKNYGIL